MNSDSCSQISSSCNCPINYNSNKICDVMGYFLNQNTGNSKFCFANSEKKKPFKHVCDGAYCPITWA